MVVVAGCGRTPETPPDAGLDGGVDAGGIVDGGAPQCTGLSEADCRDAGCEVIRAWRPDAGVTFENLAYAGCRTPDGTGGLSCSPTVTCATKPLDSGCWFFKDVCVPDGWQRRTCDALACPRP